MICIYCISSHPEVTLQSLRLIIFDRDPCLLPSIHSVWEAVWDTHMHILMQARLHALKCVHVGVHDGITGGRHTSHKHVRSLGKTCIYFQPCGTAELTAAACAFPHWQSCPHWDSSLYPDMTSFPFPISLTFTDTGAADRCEGVGWGG